MTRQVRQRFGASKTNIGVQILFEFFPPSEARCAPSADQQADAMPFVFDGPSGGSADLLQGARALQAAIHDESLALPPVSCSLAAPAALAAPA